MGKFVIAPLMRLHEWVAREKGYFDREGLDYEFRDQLISPDGKLHDLGDKIGAFQTFERGRTANVNCACHWTVNVAASAGHGKLYPHAYSVAPAAVFVRPVRLRGFSPGSIPAPQAVPAGTASSGEGDRRRGRSSARRSR